MSRRKKKEEEHCEVLQYRHGIFPPLLLWAKPYSPCVCPLFLSFLPIYFSEPMLPNYANDKSLS